MKSFWAFGSAGLVVILALLPTSASQDKAEDKTNLDNVRFLWWNRPPPPTSVEIYCEVLESWINDVATPLLTAIAATNDTDLAGVEFLVQFLSAPCEGSGRKWQGKQLVDDQDGESSLRWFWNRRDSLRDFCSALQDFSASGTLDTSNVTTLTMEEVVGSAVASLCSEFQRFWGQSRNIVTRYCTALASWISDEGNAIIEGAASVTNDTNVENMVSLVNFIQAPCDTNTRTLHATDRFWFGSRRTPRELYCDAVGNLASSSAIDLSNVTAVTIQDVIGSFVNAFCDDTRRSQLAKEGSSGNSEGLAVFPASVDEKE